MINIFVLPISFDIFLIVDIDEYVGKSDSLSNNVKKKILSLFSKFTITLKQ